MAYIHYIVKSTVHQNTKNKELSFALNFPSGRAGKIQFSRQESQIDNFGDGYIDQFLTLASKLNKDTKWRKLVEELEIAQPSSPDQFG